MVNQVPKEIGSFSVRSSSFLQIMIPCLHHCEVFGIYAVFLKDIPLLPAETSFDPSLFPHSRLLFVCFCIAKNHIQVFIYARHMLQNTVKPLCWFIIKYNKERSCFFSPLFLSSLFLFSFKVQEYKKCKWEDELDQETKKKWGWSNSTVVGLLPCTQLPWTD